MKTRKYSHTFVHGCHFYTFNQENVSSIRGLLCRWV